MQAAGMAEVPQDLFSEEPLKMTVMNGDLIIYSAGDDGKDDNVRIDSQCLFDGEGNVVFPLNKWS